MIPTRCHADIITKQTMPPPHQAYDQESNGNRDSHEQPGHLTGDRIEYTVSVVAGR